MTGKQKRKDDKRRMSKLEELLLLEQLKDYADSRKDRKLSNRFDKTWLKRYGRRKPEYIS